MSKPHNDPEAIARATLNLLETRLRRLEFLLSGTSDIDGVPVKDVQQPLVQIKAEDTVSGKLTKLQRDLNNLRKLQTPAGKLVRDVENLHTKLPELFDTSTPTVIDLSDSSTIVLSHAPLYPETASRLSSLQSLQIPPADHSAKLINLQPRLNAALRTQQDLETEAIQLRDRSAKCLEWWVKVGVVGMGELWEDWESRTTKVSRGVRRIERLKELDSRG